MAYVKLAVFGYSTDQFETLDYHLSINEDDDTFKVMVYRDGLADDVSFAFDVNDYISKRFNFANDGLLTAQEALKSFVVVNNVYKYLTDHGIKVNVVTSPDEVNQSTIFHSDKDFSYIFDNALEINLYSVMLIDYIDNFGVERRTTKVRYKIISENY